MNKEYRNNISICYSYTQLLSTKDFFYQLNSLYNFTLTYHYSIDTKFNIESKLELIQFNIK